MITIRSTVLAVAALGVAATGGAMTGKAWAATELVHGAWPPAPTYMNAVTLPKAFKAIEEETKGEIKWKLVPGGQLADPKSTFQAVQEGLMAAGLGISTYVPNLVPSLNTIYSTIVFHGDVIPASGAAVETLTLNCPSCIAEFRKINAVPLAGWTSAQYYLQCTTPVAKLDDLKGKRIRGTGGNNALWQMAGAVPIAATLPEAVTLLQRGGMDCQHGVMSWLKTFGYADFAKYVTDYPLGLTGPAIGMMMNRDVWNKFTPAQKQVHLKQAAYISAAQAIGEFTIDNEKHFKEVQDTKGVKLIKPADPQAFADLVAKFDKLQRDQIIADQKKFGVADPGAIIDSYKKNLVKWQGLTKDVGRDIDKFSDLIWREIYSKVDPSKL
jgi:TRAP-type C4-dicarboxylate transport system substrate-binding protein